MDYTPELLLVATVAVVGVLHTIVPDHWVPITLLARQRGWSSAETARAALIAGSGHVGSTLLIALVVWLAGVAVATRFGHFVDAASSIALIGFGGWIAISSWRDLRRGSAHRHTRGHGGHGHSHDFSFLAGARGDDPTYPHGPELQRVETGHGAIELSIFEDGVPPRFRLTAPIADRISVETLRNRGPRQTFILANRGAFWESLEDIPEPHEFHVAVRIEHGGHLHSYTTAFAEHDHSHHGHGDPHSHDPSADPLYAPLHGDTAVLARHAHRHRHSASGSIHEHWHDHSAATAHTPSPEMAATPPLHVHKHKMSGRAALLLILGSSPMVEGIPAFFAAGKYGVGVILLMSIVFATSTIAMYVLLCVYSTAGLRRVRLGAFERYGEVLSGAFIALVGIAFWIWPAL